LIVPDNNQQSLYRALLTRTDDGVTIFTCPLIPELHVDCCQYPTIVNGGTTFHIASKGVVKVTMYAVTGIKVAESQLIDGTNQITAPYAAGVYILVFDGTNGNIQSEKIVVK